MSVDDGLSSGRSIVSNFKMSSVHAGDTTPEDGEIQLLSYDSDFLYTSMQISTSLDGTPMLFFTWHKEECTTFKSLQYIKRFLVTRDVSGVTINEPWNINDTNPFSDTLPSRYIDDIEDITDKVSSGGLYREMIDSGLYVIILVCFQSNKKDKNGNYLYYGTWSYSTVVSNSHVVGRAPSLTYNNNTKTLTIGKSRDGMRVLEFYNTDHAYGYPSNIHNEETLNEMYLTTLLNIEGYGGFSAYWAANNYLKRWAKGSYIVAVDFQSTINKSNMSSNINNAINLVNSIMSSFGISFSRNDNATNPNIEIIVDTEYNLFGYAPSDNTCQGGEWYVPDDEVITYARIKLACDYYSHAPYVPEATVAFEELLQCMGAGYDQDDYPFNTIHSDFNYYNKSAKVYTKDKQILQLIYSDILSPGDRYADVAKKLNIPIGFTPCWEWAETYDEDEVVEVPVSFFGGGTYKVRAFIADSDDYRTPKSDWITIENSRPINWNWQASNGNATATATQKAYTAVSNKGYLTDFSYLVWNDLVNKVQEFMEYVGIANNTIGRTLYGYSSATTYATMLSGAKMTTSDKVMTAKRFNIVRFCIGSMEATGMNDFNTGDTIKGSYFTTLTTKLNAIT